ncbi:threonine synthase [Alienimonas chondri]|uniref:Threonine synthase n=1 Tax=Alienimonas chondri TaxID=2681879 RepID=A0ABX1VAZ6_9PLAN|nr:threonine synthase [Alienimonas chondri]NNJ25106.1 hypothetical protein [Alienimonas chondri]
MTVAYQTPAAPADASEFDLSEVLPTCKPLGGLLDIEYDWDRVEVPDSLSWFEKRWSTRRNPLDFSGVWRFRELLPFAPDDMIVTVGEGQTMLRRSDRVAKYCGLNAGCLHLQYEGLNPSGSFKDNGMTAASTHARMVGAKLAACASTGNTSASLALYAGASGHFRCVVFVGSGKIAFGKLSQALDYGAVTLQIEGDFDDALMRVREVCDEANIYLCNSVNPFRLEGQKTIIYRILEGMNWEVPDWIVVPGGNLGNSSAFGKALIELKKLNLIDRLPRLAIINAGGANTLFRLYEHDGLRWNDGEPDEELVGRFYGEMDAENRRANTLASAIQINRPVNLYKCLRALDATDGVVREAHDPEILDAKAQVGAGGFGCEPASAASVAGIKALRAEGIIAPSDRVVGILTGHELKDPDATVNYHRGDGASAKREFSNAPIPVANDAAAILKALEGLT